MFELTIITIGKIISILIFRSLWGASSCGSPKIITPFACSSFSTAAPSPANFSRKSWIKKL